MFIRGRNQAVVTTSEHPVAAHFYIIAQFYSVIVIVVGPMSCKTVTRHDAFCPIHNVFVKNITNIWYNNEK